MKWIFLLLSCSCYAQVLKLPNLVVPPPNTNLYYLSMNWSNPAPCGDHFTISYGTNAFQYGTSFQVPISTNVNVSNLVRGITYHFDFDVFWCGPAQDWQFPPSQLPLTNTVTIGCTGQLQMTDMLKGPWMNVTNKVFRLTQNRNAYWRSLSKEVLTFTMTNNQVNYGQHMLPQ